MVDLTNCNATSVWIQCGVVHWPQKDSVVHWSCPCGVGLRLWCIRRIAVWLLFGFNVKFHSLHPPRRWELVRRQVFFSSVFGFSWKKKNLGRPRRPMFRAPSAPLLGGACGAHSLKNFRRVMRIPNMCLVLKLDNGKVVSIANGQTDRITEWPNHPVPY